MALQFSQAAPAPVSLPGSQRELQALAPDRAARADHLRLGYLFQGLPDSESGKNRKDTSAVYGLWPSIWPIARADSSDFTKNPAAGLSVISST